jgi:hypothetical protein
MAIALRSKVIELGASTILIIFGGLGWLTSGMWFAGITPTQTARILIEDRKFGARALVMAHWWGDRILDPLRKVSGDFAALDNRNTFWVAELLTRNSSGRSRQLAQELFYRTSPLPKLVGAVGLAARGDLPQGEFAGGGTMRKILTDERNAFHEHGGRRLSDRDSTLVELALIVAKYSRSKESVPDILALIENRPAHYGVHANACDALAQIGDPRAIPILEKAMSSSDFHALAEAFRALVALSDNRAIPLAIDRISPEIGEKNSGFVVKELARVTGQDFGFNREHWKQWWNAQARQTTTKAMLNK